MIAKSGERGRLYKERIRMPPGFLNSKGRTMAGKENQKEEIDIEDGMELETMPKKACPQCGTLMRWLDGDYMCVACNGAEYGPEEG